MNSLEDFRNISDFITQAGLEGSYGAQKYQIDLLHKLLNERVNEDTKVVMVSERRELKMKRQGGLVLTQEETLPEQVPMPNLGINLCKEYIPDELPF